MVLLCGGCDRSCCRSPTRERHAIGMLSTRAVYATAAVTSAAGEPEALYPASGLPSLSEDARIGLCGLATVLVVLLRVNVAHTEAGKF